MKHIKFNKEVVYLIINIILFAVNMYFALQMNFISIVACILSVIAIILFAIMIINDNKNK